MSRGMTQSTEPWIGKVPSEWEETKIKYAAPIHNERADTNDGYIGLENVESWTGKTVQSDSVATGESVSFQKDDVLFGKLRPYLAKALLVEKDGCGSTEFLVMRPEAVVPKYLAYIVRSKTFVDCVNVSTYGAKMPRANSTFIGNLRIPIPSEDEQHAIVRYLDTKCSAIDEAIERHKKIIEKLEEYRKAEISQSVTRGMSTGVKTRPSGDRCTGDIPAHWGYCKILYVLAMPITDGPHETPTAVDEGIPFISAEAVSQGNGKIDFDHMWGCISQEFYEQCCKKYIPQKDDIYMIKSGATTGKVAIVDTDRVFTIWSPLAVLRVNKGKMTAKYLFYYVQSNSYQQQVELGWNYGTQQNIGMRMVERLKVCVPPLEEQDYITAHLDKVWDEVNASIERENTIIEKLEEYKKSIIYNAVTGKIDCREAVK